MNLDYIIQPDYIKKWHSGYIDGNVDDNSLYTFILIAQDIRIQPIIGYNLLNKILLDIRTYGAPQGDAYIKLVNNFIAPALSLYAINEAYLALDTKITNKGMLAKNSDYSEIADYKKVKDLQSRIFEHAQFYGKQIEIEIENNLNAYPEYSASVGINREAPSQNNYYGGIFLDDEDCSTGCPKRYYR